MGFMIPTAIYFSRSEAIEYACPSAQETEGYTAGWYGYLSAPGYLDRTDYSGPFETEEEAFAYVMEFYGVDENGDDLSDDDDATSTPEDDARAYGPHGKHRD